MHLKRYSMPGFWPLSRKGETFVTSPMPGPHPKYRCIPLKVLVRDFLKLAETSQEAGKILNSGKVFVDKKVRKEPKFPVGLMDVFEIPELNLRYRVNIGRRGLVLEKLGEAEAGFKLCKIVGKKTIKGGNQQLNLHDGRNVLAKGAYGIGDSVMLEIPGQKIAEHFQLRKGETAVIMAGRNVGVRGTIKEIKERKSMLDRSTITIESEKGREIETPKDYVMVGSIHVAEKAGDRKPEVGKEAEPPPVKERHKGRKEKEE